MLFITNRMPAQPNRSENNRPISFPVENNDVSQSVYYCRRDTSDSYVEIGSEAFMQNVKDSPAEQVLFFIHGFSNLPEPNIFPRTEQLQALFDKAKPNLVQVIPLIWPCDDDAGIIQDYWDDQKSADQSGYAFARVLQKFMAWRDAEDPDNPCRKRINVLAHSMGNRVLRETLQTWDKYDLSRGVPLLFRNTFLVAADVVNETLETDQPGVLMSYASRNVIVYYASDDLALRASKVSNLRNAIASRRLGHSGPENMGKVPKNVFAVDCDDFNSTYDFPTGHTYFLEDGASQPGKVFEHICNCLQRGRVFPTEENRRTIILSE